MKVILFALFLLLHLFYLSQVKMILEESRINLSLGKGVKRGKYQTSCWISKTSIIKVN